MTTRFKTLTPESIKYIVIHCAATPASMDIGVKEIDLWHRQRGFDRVGYHFIIRRSGIVELGRPLEMPGAHAQGFNLLSWGICLVGGIDVAGALSKPEANFTEAQYESLSAVVGDLVIKAPNAKVLGHRDLPSPHARLKACPSFDAQHWYATGEVRS